MTNEKFKIRESVFDTFTLNILKKAESKGFFYMEELSPLYTGKEANVFRGKGNKGKVIVKIYRMGNCNFNKMYDYIKMDSRYLTIKRKRRNVVLKWVEREFSNLLRAREYNVRCPSPYLCIGNVIVMQEINAFQLKDRPPEEPIKFYKLVVNEIYKLLKAGLVHGDLSSFNVLNFRENPYLIDFSQSTTTRSTNSKNLLERDLRNINLFFRKKGVEEKELKKLQDFLS